MSKFVLIDQSIVDFAGHHYEYAARVLNAARLAGHEPVLAVNRRCRLKGRQPWTVVPAYKYGFWEVRRPGLLRRLAGAVRGGYRRQKIRLKARIIFSHVGWFWLGRRDWRELIARQVTEAPSTLFLAAPLMLLAYIAMLAVGLLQALWALVPLGNYVARVTTAWRRLGRLVWMPVTLVGKGSSLRRALGVVRKRTAFREDTRRLLRRVKLAPGDIVFVPTINETEMLGLGDFLAKSRPMRQVSWHLLFRRNIYKGRDAEYQQQDERLRPLRNAFRNFDERAVGHDVRFYTDTDELTAQYNRLGVARFATLPIPVGEDYRRKTTRGTKTPLKVVYAGDARTEKGYQYVPVIVDALAYTHLDTGKAAFVLQSNFNTPNGEPRVAVARSQLAARNHPAITLLYDALASDAYRELVLDADVLLAMYDADEYYARSSGVFVEAIAAGIPVVVPAGSWMALQLAETVYQHHLALRDTVPIVHSRGLEDLTWRVAGAMGTRKVSVGEVPGEAAAGSRPGEAAAGSRPGEAAAGSRPGEAVAGSRPGEAVAGSRPVAEMAPIAAPAVKLGTVRRSEGGLVLGGGFGRRTRLPVPPWTSHVLVTCSRSDRLTGEFVELRIDQYDARRAMMGRRRVISGTPSRMASACIPLDRGVSSIALVVGAAYSTRPVVIDDLRIDFLSARHDVPTSAGGVVYVEVSDAIAGVRNVLDHAPHYVESAARVAASLGQLHRPETLVDRLTRGDVDKAAEADARPGAVAAAGGAR